MILSSAQLCLHANLIRDAGQQLRMCLALQCGALQRIHFRSKRMFIRSRVTGDGKHSVAAFSRKDSWFAGMPDIIRCHTGLASSIAVMVNRDFWFVSLLIVPLFLCFSARVALREFLNLSLSDFSLELLLARTCNNIIIIIICNNIVLLL